MSKKFDDRYGAALGWPRFVNCVLLNEEDARHS